MHIAYTLDHRLTDQPVVLTIGKFDGLHLGHQQMIRTVVERARSQGILSAVVTFDPHPAMVLRPEKGVRLLSSLEERIELIAALGPEFLLVAPFNRDTMNTPAYDYMRQLCTVLPLHELWVGENFALGRNREGNALRLSAIGKELGYTVNTLEPVMVDGARVSSSRARSALNEGNVAGAARLLGRPFGLHCVVIEGDRRGRAIGFPTANLSVAEQHALPADGVYACYAYVDGHRQPAVTNIGLRPTFGEVRRTVETHLLDWTGSLYGQMVRLEFVQRLRGEHRFNSVSGLIAQIKRDVEHARALLMADTSR